MLKSLSIKKIGELNFLKGVWQLQLKETITSIMNNWKRKQDKTE